jgi:hypothetical protein
MLASLRIVATYPVFSQTYDEVAHIATGMEWLDRGTYAYEPLHPPLARVAVALGPFLDGRTSQGKPDMWQEGPAILGQGPTYYRTLTLARLGILPFFWVACLVVYCWGRRYYDEQVACLALFIFSMLPPILAHSGLATTDMALTAMVGAAFLTAAIWCEQPNLPRTLGLGLTTALAVLSKFSALAFLPAAGLAAGVGYLWTEKPSMSALVAQIRVRARWLPLAVITALLLIWAGYRFSIGTLNLPRGHFLIPFPELFLGLQQLAEHERLGALNYLFGRISTDGWWYYYFIDLGVKTPLSVLVLASIGVVACVGAPQSFTRWLAPAFSGGIVVVCIFNHINLGIRHILPVYIGFSLIAAAGTAALIDLGRRNRAAYWIAGGLLLELTASSVLSHPDYLAYFNPLAGTHPEKIVIDSDLDWGQDMKRLSLRLRELGVKQVAFTSCKAINPAALGLPPLTPTDFLHPSPGWNAIDLTALEFMAATARIRYPQLRLWPELIPPTERIGKSILLFHFPDILPPLPAALPIAHLYCP